MLAVHAISPNPARGGIGVDFSVPHEGRASLSLFDVSGRRVAARDLDGLAKGSHETRLDWTRRVASGVYFLVLSQDGARERARVTILE